MPFAVSLVMRAKYGHDNAGSWRRPRISWCRGTDEELSGLTNVSITSEQRARGVRQLDVMGAVYAVFW